MKKEFKFATLIFIGFLLILWLEKPIRELLISFQIEELTAKYSSGLLVRIVLIMIGLALVKKLDFRSFSGLVSPGKFTNIQAVIIPLMFILGGIFSNWSTYLNAPTYKLILFFAFVLSVGMVEELFFRGTIFPLCIQAFKSVHNPILMGAIVSGSLFGLVHFVNLLNQPDNVAGIVSQAFFALSIGIFFSGLMVRTENILIPIVIHALVNFGFGAAELENANQDLPLNPEETGLNWNSIIPTTLFFTLIAASGIYMILKSNKNLIMKKLGME
ncbi:MAG: CPBP family intramembrane glutamic endopeptidase [Saprospiraceae bacterium]